MPISTSSNLKLLLRTYTADGAGAATVVRTQIPAGWRLRFYLLADNSLVATGTSAGALGGTGANITGAVTMTVSVATDAALCYARIEKADGTVWVRGSCGVPGSGADCIVDGPIIAGGTVAASVAVDFPATGGGGTGGGTNYVPSVPPAGVKRWMRRATDPSFYVPLTFVGLHRDGGPPLSGSSYGAPNFSFGSVRWHDADGSNYSVASQWARIDGDANGVRDWTYPDRHRAHSDVNGKHGMWTHCGTPPGFQKYPPASTQAANAPQKEYFPYPYIADLDALSWNNVAPYRQENGGGSPPADAQQTAWGSYVAAVMARYPEIKLFEHLNEPDFGVGGTGTQNTYTTTRASARINAFGFADSVFFTGTASDAVRMAKTTKDNLPVGTKLAVGAFVYQSSIDPYWGKERNAVWRYMTCQHPTITSIFGRDLCDVFTFHTYMNSGQTANKVIDEIDGYRSVLALAGVPSTMPMMNSEAGWLGGPNTAANAQFVGVQCARLLLIHAGMGMEACYLYKWSREAWMGFAVDYPVVGTEIAKVTSIAGKTVRQAAELTDDTVWVECEDGTKLRA